MLNKIQIKILTNILRSEGLKYSQARPKTIENDLYNYHLKFLVKKGFVIKRINKYVLTIKGKKFVQRLDASGNIKEYFRFSVLPYTVRIENGKKEILLHKRKRHPYYGDIGTVSGKVNLGEKIEDAAARKLKEETNLGCKFKFIGVLREIRRSKDKEIIEDTLYHVCYGENPNGELIKMNKFGEHFWDTFDNALKYQRKNVTSSTKSEEILRRIKSRDLSLFYFTEDFVMKRFS